MSRKQIKMIFFWDNSKYNEIYNIIIISYRYHDGNYFLSSRIN